MSLCRAWKTFRSSHQIAGHVRRTLWTAVSWFPLFILLCTFCCLKRNRSQTADRSSLHSFHNTSPLLHKFSWDQNLCFVFQVSQIMMILTPSSDAMHTTEKRAPFKERAPNTFSHSLCSFPSLVSKKYFFLSVLLKQCYLPADGHVRAVSVSLEQNWMCQSLTKNNGPKWGKLTQWVFLFLSQSAERENKGCPGCDSDCIPAFLHH